MNNQLPNHIALSAITSGIKCKLCQQEFDLTKFLPDGEETQLQSTIANFISKHRSCTQTVKIVLDKNQIFNIFKVTDSPEKFVIDAVNKAILEIKKSG